MTRIFLFGPVAAGKSTICAALSLFFFEEKGLSPIFNIMNIDGSRTLLDWVERLRDGKFPEKTLDDTFIRVDAGFESLQRPERAGVSFYEVSGENLVRMSPLSSTHDLSDPRLEEWLQESDILLLVAPCDNIIVGRRELIQFLALLDALNVSRPTALVLSKWDIAPGSPTSPIHFARQHYPEAVKMMAREKFKSISKFGTFSIGEVQEDMSAEKRINKLTFDNGTRELFQWMVSQIRKRK